MYLSYSGGLDSTVLLHMIRKELGNDVPAVFSNTGLEFPEIVRFAGKHQEHLKKSIREIKTGKGSLLNKLWISTVPADFERNGNEN